MGEYAAHEGECCHAKKPAPASTGPTWGRSGAGGKGSGDRRRRARPASARPPPSRSRYAFSIKALRLFLRGRVAAWTGRHRHRCRRDPPRAAAGGRHDRSRRDQRPDRRPPTPDRCPAARPSARRPCERVPPQRAPGGSAPHVDASPLARYARCHPGLRSSHGRNQNSEIDPAATIFYRGRPSGLPAHALAALDLDPVTLPMTDLGAGHSETEASGCGGAGPGAAPHPGLPASGVPHRRIAVVGRRFSATAIHPHITRRGSL